MDRKLDELYETISKTDDTALIKAKLLTLIKDDPQTMSKRGQ